MNKTNEGTMLWVDPRNIILNHSENPRDDYKDIKSLQNFIFEHGVASLPPVLIRQVREDDKREEGCTREWVLEHGFRRLTSITNLINEGIDIEHVKCEEVDQDLTKSASLIMHVTQNNGEQLLPLEMANVFNELRENGWTIDSISKQIGRSGAYVSDVLKLGKCSDKIHNAIKDGWIAPSVVSKIINKYKADAEPIMVKAIKHAKSYGMNRVTMQTIEKVTKPQRTPKFEKNLTRFAEQAQNHENHDDMNRLNQVKEDLNKSEKLKTQLSQCRSLERAMEIINQQN